MFEISKLVFPVIIVIAGVVAVRNIEDDKFHKTEIKVVGYEGHTKKIRRAERHSRRVALRFRRDCRRAERALQEDDGRYND